MNQDVVPNEKNIISVIASQSTIFIEAKGRVVCLQTCENFAWEQKHSAVSNLSNLIHKCNVHRVQSKLFTLNVQSNSPTERKEEKKSNPEKSSRLRAKSMLNA